MTAKDAINATKILNDIFFMARISDPETNEVFELNENGEFVPVSICYHVWGKTCPCGNCTTLRTCRERIITDKYEILNGEVYHITSKPIEIDGHIYAYEIVMKLDNSEELRNRVLLLEQHEAIMEKAKQAAEEANKAKTSFLFNMSHDIRTPMNAIIGFNNMAQKHIGDQERVKDYLSKVDMSSRHLLSIINDVLDMARIESGKVTLEEEPVSVTEIVNDLSSIVQQNIKDKQLTLKTDFSEILNDYVYADKLRINRVLMNLLSNSIKYTNPGGTVIFTAAEKDVPEAGRAAFEFVVADNGIGMSPEYLKHIFEAFTREKTAVKRGIQGTGLGMAITKELTELMAGNIHIDSEEGKGTTTTVHFSFRIAEKPAADSGNPEVISISDLSGKHVLLAEDNRLNLEIAEEILDEYGMIVTPAENGKEAVDAYEKSVQSGHPFDLILMDVQMPFMDGYEATAQIRELEKTRNTHVPIIAMTANAFAEDKINSLNAGMDAHLSKPVDINELVKVLGNFLG